MSTKPVIDSSVINTAVQTNHFEQCVTFMYPLTAGLF